MHYHFDTLNSTSKYAKENIKNLKTGDYVTCFFQTDGYGVTGLWEGKEKNFYLSVVIEEDDILNDKLSFCVMSSIIRVLNRYTNEFNIKLPNDIFSNGKKLSGFIIEHVGTLDSNGYGIPGPFSQGPLATPVITNDISNGDGQHFKIRATQIPGITQLAPGPNVSKYKITWTMSGNFAFFEFWWDANGNA